MQNDLVVKDNALINASYNLEVTEQRLILLSIIKARETGQGITSDSRLQIHASDYAERFDVTKEAAYDALKNAVNNLFERKFSFKEQIDTDKEIVIKSRWISQMAYIPHLAILEVIFAPAVVPLITRLEKHFTSYQIKQIAQQEPEIDLKALHAKIGHQALQIDFLEGALRKIGQLSGKK